jgi:choline dehydrogenase-like flavoprotein
LDDERQVIIIGTGPCGAAAAWALYREGIPFTVLEAGDEHSASGLTVRAPGLTVMRRRRELVPTVNHGGAESGCPNWYVELSAGGLSNHWTCAVPRFSQGDFDDGARLDERHRWPVSYDDLVDDYASMERLLAIAASGETFTSLPAGEVKRKWRLAADWDPIARAAEARGHGLTALPLAYGASWTVTSSGTPFNSYVRILKRIPQSPRARVIFNARATHLEWSADKGRVTRVFFRDAKTGEERSIGGSAFVVAAGAVNSARLLLDSRSATFPDGLGNTEGLLGRYLHDHPLAKVAIVLERPISIHPPAYLTRAPYDATAPLRGVACVFWSSTGARLRSLARGNPDKLREVGFNLFGTMPPRAEDRVEILPDRRNGEGASEVSLKIRFDDDTRKMLEEARERLLEILDAAKLGPRVTLWEIAPPGTSVHFAGTVRMHASPKFGMLDQNSRLHAVKNVLVVDSAAFTTGPEKNPTLTAMALASRASRGLARELRS